MRAHRTLSSTTAVVALAFLALLGTGTHTVSRGETLQGIAARHRTTIAALTAANGITNPNRIYAGTRLVVPTAQDAPAPAPATPPAAATASYTVKRGDTLGSIASRSGTTIAAVVALNTIRNANLIRIGQRLTLPTTDGAVAAAPAPGVPSAPPSAHFTTPRGAATHHVVKSGDTLGRVAALYGISQAQIIAANGITGDRIYLGQRLQLVPTSAPVTPPATVSGVSHTVTAGQTLSDIARHYGATIRAIQDANSISDPDLVRAGQLLTIPVESAPAGGLVCPIQGPMQHMNDWGFPRSGGRFHEGNDLFAARGTPAVAMGAGTVVQTVGRIGGKQVKLLGDDGVTYYYTHLDGFGAVGHVSAGEVIGYVGSSGNAAGGPTHVHFEVHPGGGAAVNPYPRVSAVC